MLYFLWLQNYLVTNKMQRGRIRCDGKLQWGDNLSQDSKRRLTEKVRVKLSQAKKRCGEWVARKEEKV